ncbi:PREDICTED: nardilysin-like [Acromyrmex echinatior]|uniref:nardilysin-like n=1 Tax=Acromyrmex echinatior TaxID=103372 RepID=UPI000580D6B7|nr:PREDICTED: nardilysin-like [Acromyrmex echinatior]
MSEMQFVVEDEKRNRVEYLEPPIKSENDEQEYRAIRLPNGFTTLLISNEHSKPCTSQDSDKKDEEVAHCCLCVGAGCFNSLITPGLACYFEKLLEYTESENYLEVLPYSYNNFDAFISKYDGFTYASTECEYTIFYFQIKNKYLLSALDRFAAILIKPLKKDNFKQWREEVEAELRIVSSSYRNRIEQLFSFFALPGHPANMFPKDSFMQLYHRVDDNMLFEEMVKFKIRHYSAHRIKFVIQAKLPLDTLENNVIKCFFNVPSNWLPPDNYRI